MKSILPLIFKTLGALPLGFVRALGALTGTLLWLQRGRAYKITMKNLRNCLQLDHEQAHQLARKSLRETAKTACEAGTIWRNSWAWLEEHIVAREGEELMREELAKGKGLLVLAPHLGNWEVVAPYLASIAPLTAMYQPSGAAALDDLILSGRSKNNIQMAPTNRKGVSMLLKALQGGTIVGILPDQVPEKNSGGEPALLYGRYAMTMTLIHSLIDRTQCRVVSVFAQRVDGGFKLVTLPADPLIYSADQAESLLGLNKSVEACVQLAPAQYQWEYNRYRWVPPEIREWNKDKEVL